MRESRIEQAARRLAESEGISIRDAELEIARSAVCNLAIDDDSVDVSDAAARRAWENAVSEGKAR
jgi:hypothetical protein